ncbi:hypothetical protein CK489_05760 [Bradyrhizobium sp. UFLA03-84]|nr:hypothetical protein CK489_05760 [Bradyrhizobium sp. UFLA03-84]
MILQKIAARGNSKQDPRRIDGVLMGAILGRAIFQVMVVLAAVGIVALACTAVRGGYAHAATQLAAKFTPPF